MSIFNLVNLKIRATAGLTQYIFTPTHLLRSIFSSTQMQDCTCVEFSIRKFIDSKVRGKERMYQTRGTHMSICNHNCPY